MPHSRSGFLFNSFFQGAVSEGIVAKRQVSPVPYGLNSHRRGHGRKLSKSVKGLSQDKKL